jgi:hypothetical protein
MEVDGKTTTMFEKNREYFKKLITELFQPVEQSGFFIQG